MLGRRRRQRPYNKPALVHGVVFDGTQNKVIAINQTNK